MKLGATTRSERITPDLRELEDEGLPRRPRGGALSIEPLFYEPFRHDSSFQEQIERHAGEKRRIALFAARRKSTC
jgi:DeoR/GlpR family transcriptional regulator of sugar metabolism